MPDCLGAVSASTGNLVCCALMVAEICRENKVTHHLNYPIKEAFKYHE
ncbi:MAG: hypothetical protein ACRYGB_11715 [Janthinobacterium lividum]